MKAISKYKKVLIIILSFILLFPAVRVDATIGNVNSFIRSDDLFPGDEVFVSGHCSTLSSQGYPTILLDRPTMVYGLQQHLKYSESIFISCHGRPGELVLLSGSTLSSAVFRPTDVPADMECRIAYLSACYSACKNEKTGKNLCSTLIDNGYQAVIGYTSDVDIRSSRIFEEAFYYYLSDGASVNRAVELAKKFMSKRYSEEYKDIEPYVDTFGNLGIGL